MFLLDTNIVSELVKRNPDGRVLTRLNAEPASGLFLSAVSVFELRFGAARSVKPASLWARIQRDILGRFQVVPFTEQDALAAADLMAPLVARGQNIALQDVWLFVEGTVHNDRMKPAWSPAQTPLALFAMLLAASSIPAAESGPTKIRVEPREIDELLAPAWLKEEGSQGVEFTEGRGKHWVPDFADPLWRAG